MSWRLAFQLVEKNLLPETFIRIGIRKLLRNRLNEFSFDSVEQQQNNLSNFINQLKHSPIAIDTDSANEQHYLVPSIFFQKVLGPRAKYSSGYWPNGVEDLKQAEEEMLTLYEQRAEIKDGMRILDLGCGWGSLCLWLAERYPSCSILAVSNSKTQRQFIETAARNGGFNNLQVTTSDINVFNTEQEFDRILSIEMFEHMKNYELLMNHISHWLKPEGKLFVHIFSHRRFAYSFETNHEDDWMARNFFTGGTMPSDNLLLYFQNDLSIERHWTLSGKHYKNTAEAWLKNMYQNRDEIISIFDEVYGKSEGTRWFTRWKVFFITCSELWGFNNGTEWIVSHYRFKKD